MSAGDGGGLPGLSVRRPFLAAVMNLLIVIAGIAALMGVEVRELPDVDRPVVSVRANYPGASPTTVDAELTSVVEAAVARVEGVQTVRASSEEGNFRLSAEFAAGRDLTAAANDIREAVSRIERDLPDAVDNLFVVKSDRDAEAVAVLAVSSLSDPLDVLTERVETDIVPELTAIDGVAEVRVYGERERVIRVAVSPQRLAAFGLSVGEVSETLRAAQFDVPVGSFAAGDMEVLVRADASVTDPDRIKRLMLRDPVRLGDVADVFFSMATPESVARNDGMTVLQMGLVRQAGANTVSIADGLSTAVSRLERRFPELRFSVTADNAIFIRGAIAEVLTTLVLALVIVVGVIWLFLGRLGATLVPAVAVPVALIGALAAIWAMGFSINLVTLLALVLATGVVVDDAIVVTENIARRREDGLGPMAASVVGTRQVFFAVIATTLTLIAVFVPISLLPSEAGRLFSEFGVVLAAAVALSSFVALSLCPMIAARVPSLGEREGGSPLGRAIGGAYAALLAPALRAPLVAVALACAVAGGALAIHGEIGEELVPDEDRGEITVRMQGPDGTGLDYTDRQVERVEAMFRPWIEAGVVEGVTSITGRYDLNRGEVRARLAPWEERDVAQSEIEADIKPQLGDLPGARAYVRGSNSLGVRGGGGGGLEMALTGPTYEQIAVAAENYAARLREIPGVSRVTVQYQATQPQLSIAIDRERATDLGVPMEALATTLRALIDEDEVAELTIGDRSVPVLVQSAAGAVRDPTDLLNLSVRAASGQAVPLSQLVSFSESGVAAELDRLGQRRAIEIDVATGIDLPLRDAVDAAQEIADGSLPEGIGLIFRGEAASLEETSSELALTFAIAILVVFLVLVAQFESLTSAAVVMLTIPFAVSAALYAMWLSGTTLNIYSQIGVLMLTGITAKNGILLVEFADQLRDRGHAVWEAAGMAARARLRAISMTLISTVLAGLPLILGDGPGSEARAAIGWVVFGGLGLAAGFTLFLTPALYVLVAGFSRPRAAASEALAAEMAAVRQRSPAE